MHMSLDCWANWRFKLVHVCSWCSKSNFSWCRNYCRQSKPWLRSYHKFRSSQSAKQWEETQTKGYQNSMPPRKSSSEPTVSSRNLSNLCNVKSLRRNVENMSNTTTLARRMSRNWNCYLWFTPRSSQSRKVSKAIWPSRRNRNIWPRVGYL
jgi:hypothetical protein